MPERLEDFKFQTKKEERQSKFDSILDGAIWKVKPSEFDYDDNEDGLLEFLKHIKTVAKEKYKCYIQYRLTGNNQVILQLMPWDWQPRNGRKKKA